MADHAKLSASGSKRWMACPPSAMLEAAYPDKGSVFAAEGTHAHAYAEMTLRHYTTPMRKSEKDKERAVLAKDQYHSKALEEHVQTYTDLVIGKYRAALKLTKDAYLGIEIRVDFGEYVPGGFGTSDVIIIADGTMKVIDLKYGQGVRVDAIGNPQMRLYALGALAEYDYLYNITRVRMTIVQPRISDGITSEELTVDELRQWGTDEVKPRAELAATGGGEFAVGDHCQFCKHRAKCRARAEDAQKLIREDFAREDPTSLADSEIGQALIEAQTYLGWIKDLQTYALSAALRGEEIPGWKVVEGRSNRAYSDQDAVAQKLLDAGYDEAIIYERSLLGITKMESAVGKRKLAELAGELIVKPEGKPTLVTNDDPRPVFTPAKSSNDMFKEETIDD